MNVAVPWLQTHSGRRFPLVDPRPSDIYWPDVVYALAHVYRFGGHAGAYSVAQHSIVVADQLRPEWRVYGLLHDAHEAYIGDVPTPLKNLLEATAAPAHSLSRIVQAIDRAVFEAADLCYPVPQEIDEAVHIADRRALMTERRDLMNEPPPESWGEEYERVALLPQRIVRWSTQQTIARFAGALLDCGLRIPGVIFTV